MSVSRPAARKKSREIPQDFIVNHLKNRIFISSLTKTPQAPRHCSSPWRKDYCGFVF